MTFEPTRLEKPGDSLEREVQSVAILRERLEQLRSTAASEDKDGEGDSARKSEAEHAEEVLDAYSEWLADTSGAFAVERRDGEGQVQDIIDEVLFRQRYISNQLALLSLAKDQTPRATRIDKLQRYNALKDVAQELMGLVAENRGVAVGRLYDDREFGVSAED